MEEEEKRPRKQNHPLNYDEAILLLKFFLLNDTISFKSYCDTHDVEVLGEQASDKRKGIQDHCRNRKKKGNLPSKYNNLKYPEELVQSVSFKLSFMAKQKGKNNNDKKEKKLSNKTSASLSLSPSPISSPSVQTIKCNSRNSSKNLPTSPNDVQVNFRFPLNINHPYINVQGAVPFRIPSCPDISRIGKKEIVGYHDK